MARCVPVGATFVVVPLSVTSGICSSCNPTTTSCVCAPNYVLAARALGIRSARRITRLTVGSRPQLSLSTLTSLRTTACFREWMG